MKAFIYIEQDRVVVNPKEKPSIFLFYNDDICLKKDEYNKALAGWQSNNIEVENGRYMPDADLSKMTGVNSYVKIGDKISQVENGDSCTYKIANNKATITEL